ncbi:MAG: hypothetical protein JSR74_12550 [Proteobacteria bacterium]|nr:hypothetical protein [Pseudomonadota bacterium]
MPATRVEPSQRLMDPARTFRYTPAAATDLGKRFKAMQAKAKAQARATSAPAVDPRQLCLELPNPEGHARVVQLPRKGRTA